MTEEERGPRYATSKSRWKAGNPRYPKGPPNTSQPAGWRNGVRVTGERINEAGRKRRLK